MKLAVSIVLAVCSLLGRAWAADELGSAIKADGTPVSYILTTGGEGKPRYAIVLMPDSGILAPRMSDGRLTFAASDDFLIRSRALFASGPFVVASIDATTDPNVIFALAVDLQKRFGRLDGYVIGTARSTEATMALASSLDGKVQGFVHASPIGRIAFFDTRRFKSRQLLMVHRLDTCRDTRPAAAEAAHRDFKTELIVMDGGRPVGDDCDPRAYHGYSGIEAQTVDKIKAWITGGK